MTRRRRSNQKKLIRKKISKRGPPPPLGVFLDEIEETIYIGKNGKRSTVRTKHKKKIKTLYVINKKGEIVEYGSIDVAEKKTVSQFRLLSDDMSIKDTLATEGAYKKIKKSDARGVQITVRGRTRGGKDNRIKVRVIFQKKRKDEKYLENLIVGKVMTKLNQRKLRLSQGKKVNHKSFKHLKNQQFKLEVFK